jgi:hypothetical protein
MLSFEQLRPGCSAPRVPRREELADQIVTVLRTKRRRNADLYVVDLGDGPMVVKDFAKKSWWVRYLGRVQIRHECHAYRKLEGMRGIPRFIGRIDRHALAIEQVDVTQLTYAPTRYSEGDKHLAGLRTILEEFQVRGFVHLDLRGRRNVLIRADGDILVLDLAGAVWFRPGSFWHRLWRPLIRLNYRNTLFKWKVLLTPDALSQREKVSLRRFRRLQRLWLFNRKGSADEKWPMTFPRAVELRNNDTR